MVRRVAALRERVAVVRFYCETNVMAVHALAQEANTNPYMRGHKQRIAAVVATAAVTYAVGADGRAARIEWVAPD